MTPHQSTKLYEAAGQGNCVLRLIKKGKLNAQLQALVSHLTTTRAVGRSPFG